MSLRTVASAGSNFYRPDQNPPGAGANVYAVLLDVYADGVSRLPVHRQNQVLLAMFLQVLW